MKSLIEIASQSSELEKLLLESNGEITPELESKLSVNNTELSTKIDSYSSIMERFESLADYYKSKADQYYAMAKASNSVAERLNQNIKNVMLDFDINEVCGSDIKFKLQNTKASVNFNDESLIPKEYKNEVVTIHIDKKRIFEDLSLGVFVPGANLVPNKSLRKYINKPK